MFFGVKVGGCMANMAEIASNQHSLFFEGLKTAKTPLKRSRIAVVRFLGKILREKQKKGGKSDRHTEKI